MPCPLFEPRARILPQPEPTGRLPLLFEFQGVCHASDVSSNNNFRYCNRGNAVGDCPSFPADLGITAIRFDVAARSSHFLNVLIIEEENYWPRCSQEVAFVISEDCEEPAIADPCLRAQFLQFCRAYLENSNAVNC